jgi:Cell cycle protein
VSTGAMPTTGLPFPFWSYGGSSVMASCITAALLIRVARESNEVTTLPGIPNKVVDFPVSAQPKKARFFDRFKPKPGRSIVAEKPTAKPLAKTGGRRKRRSR